MNVIDVTYILQKSYNNQCKFTMVGFLSYNTIPATVISGKVFQSMHTVLIVGIFPHILLNISQT